MSLLRILAGSAAATTLAVGLVACGGSDTSSDSADNADTVESTDVTADHGAADGKITVDNREFSLAVMYCSFDDESDSFHGPATDTATGEVAYLDADLIAGDEGYTGKVRLDIGVDEIFQTGDDFYTFGTETPIGTKSVSLAKMGDTLMVGGPVWDSQESEVGHGEIELPCP